MDEDLALEAFLRLNADDRYRLVVDRFCAAIVRLAAGYEANPDERAELIQDIHLQLWRSLRRFDGRCALKTWIYRVAHNVAADHVARERRRGTLVGIDELEEHRLGEDAPSPEDQAADRSELRRLLDLVHRLKPIDRQVMLLCLEGEDVTTIAEVTGCSKGAISTRLHRIRTLLAQHLAVRRSE